MSPPTRSKKSAPAAAIVHDVAPGLLWRVRWTLLIAPLALLLWGALWPLGYPSRERVLEFPHGAAVAKGKGGVPALPAEIRLTLGVRDVLLLRNRDVAAHVFGQVRVLPGREFRLPFEQAGTFGFACDAAPANALTVRVLAHPDPGWDRLGWRLRALADAVRELPVRGPEV
jgi:hypothetical protein